MMQVLKEGPEVVYVCVLLCKDLTMKLAHIQQHLCPYTFTLACMSTIITVIRSQQF